MNVVPTTSRFARGVVSALVHAFSTAECGARATVLMPSLYSPIVAVSVLIASAPMTPSSFQVELENSILGSTPAAALEITSAQGFVSVLTASIS
jgi:hypothetical protein